MEEIEKLRKCLDYTYVFIDELYSQGHITKELRELYYSSNRRILSDNFKN